MKEAKQRQRCNMHDFESEKLHHERRKKWQELVTKPNDYLGPHLVGCYFWARMPIIPDIMRSDFLRSTLSVLRLSMKRLPSGLRQYLGSHDHTMLSLTSRRDKHSRPRKFGLCRRCFLCANAYPSPKQYIWRPTARWTYCVINSRSANP